MARLPGRHPQRAGIPPCMDTVLNLFNQGANFSGAAPVSWPHL